MRENLIGQVFDRLTVVEQTISDKRNKQHIWYNRGVCFDNTHQLWVATWNDITGKSRRKTFSVLKYGYDEAKKLASNFRESKIKELNEQGAGYTKRHGM